MWLTPVAQSIFQIFTYESCSGITPSIPCCTSLSIWISYNITLSPSVVGGKNQPMWRSCDFKLSSIVLPFTEVHSAKVLVQKNRRERRASRRKVLIPLRNGQKHKNPPEFPENKPQLVLKNPFVVLCLFFQICLITCKMIPPILVQVKTIFPSLLLDLSVVDVEKG